MNRHRTILLSLGFAVLVYLGLTVWSNAGMLEQALKEIRYAYLPLIFLLAFTNYIVRFGNWQFYLSNLGIRQIKRKDSFQIFISGFSMAITPGKVGELIRSYFLKEFYDIPISKTGSIILVDRLTDLIAMILLAGFGALHFQYGLKILAILIVLVVILLIILSWKSLAESCFSLLEKVNKLAPKVEKLRNLYETSSTLLAPRRLIIILLVSITAWSCEALAFYFTFKAFGISASLFTAFFIYAFSMIIGAVSFLPGGLGLTEGSIAGLLVLMSIPRAEAAAATLVIRVATLWFAIALGLWCLAIVQRRLGKKAIISET